MNAFNCIYVPIGVPTFHLESAQAAFDASLETIRKFAPDVIAPKSMLLSIDDLRRFITNQPADLIILQNVTFANSAYAIEVFKHTQAPVLLWTLEEPVIDGGRLRLNSLTGAFSAGFAFKAMRQEPLHYTIGAPDDDDVLKTLSSVIMAAKLKKRLTSVNLAMIGHTPQGFGFGRALDLEMASVFGVNLLAIESRELTQIARQMSEQDIKDESKSTHSKMVGLDKTKEQNRIDFIKLYKAYKDYIVENNIQAVASRCWPDFFTDYGTPVCSVLAMLNDEAIAAACETDAYGALSMYIGQALTQEPTYLGDPVSLNKEENTITFWHCGTGACSLARKDTGAQVGVHPNRKIGPTMEFGLRPNKTATIFRIGRKPDGTFRFLIAEGEILDKPKQFLGTSLVVKTRTHAESLVKDLVKDGWEPHYAILYGDVTASLKALGEMLRIDVIQY